ncbi:MAG: class I SAM-dependent methyltransferase [Verrucomicrobia bacterium]|nr:class I SAM-dependent methyltransferase [Verrucomicrobiota bacterium]MDE3047299.1 class I SAM-dependent methyltransferase [Verrucomicrobiota bacterium]
MKPHLTQAHAQWKQFLKKDDLAIDATCGNGQDTLFLTDLCEVVGLDIQPAAIQQTRERLHKKGQEAQLFLHPHEQIDTLPLPRAPRLIVYNLGYLPGGDKTRTTMTETTLISVKKGLTLLAPDGAVSITCYPGHTEGAREEQALEQWAASLPKDQWLVCHHKWLNRLDAPSWLWISAITNGSTDYTETI